jgi:hypothetical protein
MKYYEVYSDNKDVREAGSCIIAPSYDRLVIN